MKQIITGSVATIAIMGLFWSALVAFEITGPAPTAGEIASAQSAKQPKWRYTEAGTIPTEFGELIQVNGTSGNYTLVFQDTDKVIRLVDLRGGKIPPRAISIKRKY